MKGTDFRHMGSRKYRSVLLLAVALAGPLWDHVVSAATSTWSGMGGDNNWSTGGSGGNWSGAAVPDSSDTADLAFGDSLQLTSNNNLATVPFVLNSVTFNSDAGAYVLAGNQLQFNGATSAIVQNSTSNITINNAVLMSSATTFSGTGSGDVTLNGVLSGAGPLTISSGRLILAQANSYSGSIAVSTGSLRLTHSGALTSAALTLSASSTLQLRSDTSTTFATASTTINGNVAINVGPLTTGTGQTLSLGAVSMGNNTMTVTGSNGYVLGLGAVTLNTTGTANFTVNSGSVAITSITATSGGTKSVTLAGTAAGNSVGSITLGGGGVTKNGTGTWTLTGVNSYTGATTVGTGELDINGSLGATAVSVSGGAFLGGSGTIGSTFFGGSVTVTAGTSSSTRGTINLVDGSIGTLTIQSTSGANALNLGSGTGTSVSALNFEVGATADKILIGGSSRINIANTSTGNIINLTGLGTLTGATQTIIDATSGGGNNGAGGFSKFILGTTTGNFSGYVLSLSTATANVLKLVETPNATPGNVYWKGNIDGTWNTFNGGNSNNSNWQAAATGSSDPHQVPGATTDVFFNVNAGSGILSTTLGQDFSIKSLTFTSAADGSHQVTISGSNSLTVGTGGISVLLNSGAHTISPGSVILGSDQSWTNDSASLLTISAPVNANGHVLTIAGSGNTRMNGNISGGSVNMSGTGTLTLAGTNNYAGATTVSGGTLLVTGALNASGVVSVSNATLGGTGTLGGVTITSGGVINPNTVGSVGTLSVASLTLADGSKVQVDLDSVSGIIDKLNVSGAISTTGSSRELEITLVGVTALSLNTPYQIFTGTLPAEGTFSHIVLPAGYTWDLGRLFAGQQDANGAIYATASVPEPGALVLGVVGLAAGAAAGWRRKRVPTANAPVGA